MISIINNPGSTVAYFRQENYEALLKSGSDKRELEREGVKRLLDELGYAGLSVGYKTSGQPYLQESPELYLSVSHSKGWFAVMVGTVPVGVDIQIYSERLQAGQDYFRNDREIAFENDEQALHLIWCAKEAFYKWKEGEIADLKEDFSVIEINENTVLADYAENRYSLNYRSFEKAFLVFVSG